MPDLKEQLLNDLSDGVVEMDEERVITAANRVIEKNLDAYDAIDQGLSQGMERAGRLFEEEEYFVPELLLCADAMYAGLDILNPHVKRKTEDKKLKIVIGVVEGDTHDIGKNLVKIMLGAAGYEITDLGRDVPPRLFVDKAKEISADIIAISTLMTTTMNGMADVIRLLNEQGIRKIFKVIVGGGPVSKGFSDRIGADGYASNASASVQLVKNITNSIDS
jgi:dimethylamine corrinoid protein